MESILNITNGDCAVEVMKKADIPGEFLPWRDVLHEGPVPAELSLEELSQVRAEFIVSRGWGKPEAVHRDFVERDNTLKSVNDYDKVILWFEHDLYDQLQIIQILDWFSHNNQNKAAISIICTDNYLGVLSPDKMKSLFEYEVAVTDRHLNLAKTAWIAFRSSTPEAWFALLDEDTTALPYLNAAIIRLMEEYPDSVTGLSRTAQQALRIISEGEKLPGKVFGRNQQLEDSMFMGDSSFWSILHELLDACPPLLTLPEGKTLTLPTAKDQELSITPDGLAVLEGNKSWFNIKAIDHWTGGVHFTHANTWCWDAYSGSIVKRD